MNKVAIYCRLSDEDKNKISKGDDSESIINQKLMLTEYAINKDWHIYKIYNDEDYSGADNKRPEFNKMLQDAEQKKFNIVLCKTQSRFTRDLEEVEKYIHNKFIEWGIRFVSIVDNADTDNKGNKKSRQINGLVNEWYIEDLSDNIKSVFQAKMEKGQYIASFAPYGYKKDPSNKHKLIVDDHAADIVRLIYNLYLEGYGTHTIAQMLTEKGIDRPTVYKQKNGENFSLPNLSEYSLWGHTTINRILKNPVYIGTLIQGKETTVSYKNHKRIHKDESEWVKIYDNHEPIISKENFYTVQDMLANKRRKSKIENKAHIFATKVRCKECGGSMIKCTTRGKKPQDIQYQYLKCKNYTLSTGLICNSINRISFIELKSIVENQLNEILQSYKTNEQAINKTVSKINTNDYNINILKLNNELSTIEVQIKDKNSALANLL